MKITHINKKLKIIKTTNEHFYKKAGISILIILLSSVYHSFAFLSCRFENLNKSTIIDYSSRNSMISDLSMSTLPNGFWYFLRSFHKCLFLLGLFLSILFSRSDFHISAQENNFCFCVGYSPDLLHQIFIFLSLL